MASLPNEKSGCVQGGVVLIRVLSFLAAMLKDLNKLQQRRKAVSLDPSLISVSCDVSGGHSFMNIIKSTS